MHGCEPVTQHWGTEAGGSRHPQLHSETEASFCIKRLFHRGKIFFSKMEKIFLSHPATSLRSEYVKNLYKSTLERHQNFKMYKESDKDSCDKDMQLEVSAHKHSRHRWSLRKHKSKPEESLLLIHWKSGDQQDESVEMSFGRTSGLLWPLRGSVKAEALRCLDSNSWAYTLEMCVHTESMK